MMETKAWQQYELGVDYKTRINLYKTVNVNEKFYVGDQWAGIKDPKLPTPVLNFLRLILTYKIAAVTDRRVAMNFSILGPGKDDWKIYARQLNDYSKIFWERMKMDYLTKECIADAGKTGDGIFYFYWDDSLRTGQFAETPLRDENGMEIVGEDGNPAMERTEYMGDIAVQLIDNVNFYPGNPNCDDIQKQPYIILIFRDLVSNVRKEAEKNGISKEEIELIGADEETEYMPGDLGKVELEESTKCHVLLKLYKRDGKVYAEKSTRGVVFKPEWDTRLSRYPLAMMNWDKRKSSIHGVGEITYLIPNQMFVNRMLALLQVVQMALGFPKVVYDANRIDGWDNNPMEAVGVNGAIQDVVSIINPPNASFDARSLIDTVIRQTLNMSGANDVVLGNVNPDNTSAFIATRESAMVPLQSIQERFYSMLEDIGMIWMDFWKSYYKGRRIPIQQGDEIVYVPIGDIEDMPVTIKIDAGPSSQWSEVQTIQTAGELFAQGKITLCEYLEMIPDGYITNKDELIETYKQMEELQRQVAEMNLQMQLQQMTQPEMMQQEGAPALI